MKVKITFLITLFVFISSCTNQENEFEDFDVQNVYFPVQFPVRTISLIEDSRIDNSIDLEKAFSIGAAIGGLRTNNMSRTVNIALAPELVENAFINDVPVQLMPSNYYSLSSPNTLTIPAGSFSGTIRVQLEDAFFNDTLAINANYVIPLVITPGTYNVLTGVPVIDNPDRRVISDWESGAAPKDFTMFAVKYINKYDGVYLHKGADNTLDGPNGDIIETAIYNETFIEQNFDTDIVTQNLTSSISNRMGLNKGDQFKMKLGIAEDGTITISSVEGSLPASGTGRFVDRDETDAETWGEEPRKTMFLDYTYENEGVFHQVNDTLIFRNDDTVFENFEITIEE